MNFYKKGLFVCTVGNKSLENTYYATLFALPRGKGYEEIDASRVNIFGTFVRGMWNEFR